MSMTSLQSFADSSFPFLSRSQPTRMSQSRTPGLDTLAEGSQYALEELQLARQAGASSQAPIDPGHNHNAPGSTDARHLHSYNDQNNTHDGGKMSLQQRDMLAEARSAIRKNSTAGPVRRRISRACDQCNQLRTKCDGQQPCAHCLEFGLSCEYARERKKRGKASKKDLAPGTSTNGEQIVPDGTTAQENSPPSQSSHEANGNYNTSFNVASTLPESTQQHLHNSSISGVDGVQHNPHSATVHSQAMGSNMDGLSLNYGNLPETTRPHISVSDLRSLQMMQDSNANHRSPPSMLHAQGFGSGYNDGSYSVMNSQDHNSSALNQFRLGGSTENPSASFLGFTPPTQSPNWLPLPSPSPANFPSFSIAPFTSSLRYPVLQPVLPHIASIIPQSLACDLLDVYFTSSTSSHLSPLSPYVVGFVFRKQSFLHPTKPRSCTPGLLASMLWVAAQTSEAAFLTSPPSARGRVCQKLLELTVGLLRPLIHGPATGETSPNYAANMVINGVALGGFGVSMDQIGAQSSATGAVDDVATYVHLATVVSASEYKAASMRWWTAAWSLARELKLGRELPPSANNGQDGELDGENEIDMNGNKRQSASLLNSMGHGSGSSSVNITEEEREERRRIWWLLYVMDRHLSLCYNRPLTLLDKECEGLLQPMNDDLWQAGDFSAANYRRAGPAFECTSHSMFGYFLPLMSILGEIVDLHHARNHPRFGLHFRNSGEWESQAMEITRQLDVYAQSLKEFEARYTSSLTLGTGDNDTKMEGTHMNHVSPSGLSSSTAGSHFSESIVHTKMVVAYGTHIMHVLHILVADKWDPINLLDDNDLWISSDSFITAMGHAVSAAEAASDILEYDPDLSFMPFFFGIYLLQGSFLLLLTTDKLAGDASPSVVRACETIVRAHEACVVTLNTEYQRTFRKVMRSALAQVRGRVPESSAEQHQRRREVLALYRWSGDGSGLAL
ncbi:Xylanolytic transcriptional activator xlnR [Penicillium angulare]|uniref:Xylanolytic transcriptional activator xlnR n=1 Tax=Penicillium angulare TaxID=116970 RepID=UPI0025421B61|nr:Xylanolytic transcriptional activator xlnR [Penicillium angulare]KAJ5279191.1 Xylanolytic transcriptional activator xlnR [Penicillium angulare]